MGRTTGSILPEMDISFLLICRRDLRCTRIDLDISALARGVHVQVDCRLTVSWEHRHDLVREPLGARP
jgi:hypothetical protein